MPRTSASVSREGARPACDRVVEHRSNASRAAARLPNSRCARIRACHAPSCTRSIVNNRSAAAIRAFVSLAAASTSSATDNASCVDPLTLFLKPAIECRVQPIEIIEQGGLKHLQPSRIGHGRPGDHANIDPEAIVETRSGDCGPFAARRRHPDPAHAAVRAPTAATIPSPVPGRAGSRAARSVCCEAPALVLPVPALPARPWSCATAAECSARLRPAPASGRTASGATAGRQWPHRGRRSAGWISELR